MMAARRGRLGVCRSRLEGLGEGKDEQRGCMSIVTSEQKGAGKRTFYRWAAPSPVYRRWTAEARPSAWRTVRGGGGRRG